MPHNVRLLALAGLRSRHGKYSRPAARDRQSQNIAPARYNGTFMPQLLAGKTALVLGVANKWSIAYAISSAFVREGASLVLTYQGERQRQTVEELGSELKASKVLNCDVTKPDELEHLVSELKQSSPDIDALVHSIAFANKDDLSRPFLETSRDGFLLAQEVSAYSLVSVSRAIAPMMTKGGSVTTLTYLGSTRVVQNYNVMGVAKAALEASVRYLASDLGPANIRVNAISAGPIKTASARGIKDFSKVLDGVAAYAPLRRNTDPAEVADTAVFLASDLGRGVTGNIVFVDAGFQTIGIGLQ
jgi:enoyl-[acyl-carrier protein] reductase I